MTSTPDASVIETSRSTSRTDRIGIGQSNVSHRSESALTVAADSSAKDRPDQRVGVRRQPDARQAGSGRSVTLRSTRALSDTTHAVTASA